MEHLRHAQELFSFGRRVYGTQELELEHEPTLCDLPDLMVYIIVGVALSLTFLLYLAI